jgi:glutamate--cysteine ligase catalytic subunit
MAFGMGCCCLQVTWQARDINESRNLYDQLAVLSPLMLALSAACPILKGKLVDTDVRWDVIAGAVDDRTDIEAGRAPLPTEDELSGEAAAAAAVAARVAWEAACVEAGELGENMPDAEASSAAWELQPQRLSKSRYDAISSYIGTSKRFKDKYNDTPLEVHAEAQRALLGGGVDPILAAHLAHLFARDPLVVFKERLALDDSQETDHFENFQR